MLCLQRKVKEKIIIDDNIEVVLLKIELQRSIFNRIFKSQIERSQAIIVLNKILDKLHVDIGISAPDKIKIFRKEIFDKIQQDYIDNNMPQNMDG